MSFCNIHIHAQENNWRLYMTRKADSAFLAFREKVLLRDDHTCQFCGLRSQRHMEIINVDYNYYNNRISNMKAACPLCAQCHFIESVGKSDFGGGVLIDFPDMSQSELNAFCHTLFAAIACGTDFSARAKDLYRALKLRAQSVEKKLGSGLSNPSVYGQMLIDTDKDIVNKLHKGLRGRLRLLPNFKHFGPYVTSWAEEGISSLCL